MPKNTRVERCVEKLKEKGDGKYNPYAVCQASTKQSYKTGKSLKNKRNKKMKPQLEALKEFINNLKDSKNEAFLENVIMKGFNTCFEQVMGSEDNENSITLPDTPEELEKVQDKIDEVKEAQEITDLKKAELKKISDEGNA